MKYYNSMVVFEEIPDEITLAINITNCPCRCHGCHSRFLWDDVGTELTFDELDSMIDRNMGITCICFMGGDSEPSYINDMAGHVRSRYDTLKVAWYSGKERISDEIDLRNFDYVKVGPYVEQFGGLDKDTTNQRMFEIVHGEGGDTSKRDITDRFWLRNKKRAVS